MVGTCSECGQELSWREVFAIQREWGSEVGWYSEHAHGLFSMLRRTPGTLVRLVFPSWFFASVNHRRRVDGVRLLKWIVILALLLWIGTSVIAGLAYAAEGPWSIRSFGLPENELQWHFAARDILNAMLYPYASAEFSRDTGIALVWGSFNFDNSYAITVGLIPYLVSSAFWFAMLWAVPVSRARVIEQPRLLWRGVTLGTAPMLILLIPAERALGALYVARGWRNEDQWIAYATIIVWVLGLFWQQCIWTAFIRWGLHVRPSWYINLPGFFASLLLGFYVMINAIW